MFADPNTHWWSIMAMRLTAALLAGIAFMAVADATADALAAHGPAAASVTGP